MGQVSATALALCALATACAGCLAGAGGTSSVQDGLFGVGTRWTVAGDSHGMDFEHTFVVVDVVERRGEQAYQVESVFRIEDPGVEHYVTQWLRVADLAVLEDQSNHHGVLDNGIAVDERTRTLYPTPCPDPFARKLEVGLQWKHSCATVRDSTEWSSTSGYSSHSYNHTRWATYVVEGIEEVTVPAGTFQAYRVARTGPGEDEDITTTVWVTDQACGAPWHPVIRSKGVDSHDEDGVSELTKLDCDGPSSPPWKGDGPRRWAPPITVPRPEGWPASFAPTLEELGGQFAIMPVGRWGEGRPESNPTLTKAEGPGHDGTGPVETYSVIYEVKGNPSDIIRLSAHLFTNESYAQQWTRYPIHEVGETCEYYPKAVLVVGAVVIAFDGSHEPNDGKDTTPVLAQGMQDATAALEDRFGVEADACAWDPPAETYPSWTRTSTGP